MDDDGAIDASEENALAMQTKIGGLFKSINTDSHHSDDMRHVGCSPMTLSLTTQ